MTLCFDSWFYSGQNDHQNVSSLSMTERFRYPPKGYQKHVPSQQLSDGEGLRADRTNPTNSSTLTSSISQKIQLDRIQEENSNSKRRVGENIRPKSGRISGIECFSMGIIGWTTLFSQNYHRFHFLKHFYINLKNEVMVVTKIGNIFNLLRPEYLHLDYILMLERHHT